MDNPFSIELDIHKPIECSICHGQLKYEGLGRYICEKCQNIERDDYAKVRDYLETHSKVNIAQVSDETGVTRRTIQNMLNDKRFIAINKDYLDAE